MPAILTMIFIAFLAGAAVSLFLLKLVSKRAEARARKALEKEFQEERKALMESHERIQQAAIRDIQLLEGKSLQLQETVRRMEGQLKDLNSALREARWEKSQLMRGA